MYFLFVFIYLLIFFLVNLRIILLQFFWVLQMYDQLIQLTSSQFLYIGSNCNEITSQQCLDPVSQVFISCVDFFIHSSNFKISSLIYFIACSYNSMLFSFHVFAYLLEYFELLAVSFIPKQSEKIHGIISILKNLLRHILFIPEKFVGIGRAKDKNVPRHFFFKFFLLQSTNIKDCIAKVRHPPSPPLPKDCKQTKSEQYSDFGDFRDNWPPG